MATAQRRSNPPAVRPAPPPQARMALRPLARWLRRPLLRGLPVLLAVVAVGCSGSVFQSGQGGVPPQDARSLSLIVLQTRSQYPERSGTDLPFEARPAPPEDAAKPTLALRGEGLSVEPGLRSGAATRLRAELFLDKRNYALGWLEVTQGDKASERWHILAYDTQGDPQGTFHNLYVLALPDGRTRYLVLAGGAYEKEGERYHGYEGTLIEPGPGRNLEQWKGGFKLDFGYRFPVVPAHQRKVDEAVQQFRDIRVDVERLERLRRNIAAAEGKLAALNAAQPTPETADRQRSAVAEQQGRLDALNLERDALVGTAEARIVAYYQLRRAIATEFAAYTESNPYLWLNEAGRQAAYDRWKVVEFHHPRIDELVATYLTHQPAPAKVLDARTAAMEEIARQDNWNKDPARLKANRGAEQAPSRKP